MKSSLSGEAMWCRRPSICSLFLVVAGLLAVLLLVAVYNGETDYGHTPLTHNSLLNIQQKVLKSKLLKDDDRKRQGVAGTVHHHSKNTDDSYASSSNASEDDSRERASDLTGDNAREVRVSSSTADDREESNDDAIANKPSAADREPPADRKGGFDDGRTIAEAEEEEEGRDVEEEEEVDGEDDELEDESDEGRRREEKKGIKHYFHHNWDEYNSEAWMKLPIMSSIPEAEAQPGDAVMYNRVGKCGSRSVINVMRELASRNRFHFVSSLVYNKTRISAPHEKMMVSVISRLQRPFIFQRHVHFVDFRRYGLQQPKYINIIRDPLSRMVSQYYFKRFGDGKSDRRYSGKDKYQTFDDCVLRRSEECLGKKSFYIIPFFCGQDIRCKVPTTWALNEAIRNMNDHYVATGILEELENTFRVFEKVLPDVFGGALDVYRQTGI